MLHFLYTTSLTAISHHIYIKSDQEVCRLSIGQRLKQARKPCNISQDVLAEKIGASRGVITNIEHDKIAKPQPMVINALCNVLGINKEWLLDGTGPMNISTKENQSPQVLSEIYEQAQKLSEEEQLFILDMIKSYTKHMKDASV